MCPFICTAGGQLLRLDRVTRIEVRGEDAVLHIDAEDDAEFFAVTGHANKPRGPATGGFEIFTSWPLRVVHFAPGEELPTTSAQDDVGVFYEWDENDDLF